jgi:hypothetical protein
MAKKSTLNKRDQKFTRPAEGYAICIKKPHKKRQNCNAKTLSSEAAFAVLEGSDGS